ncbi:MAG: ABC transporter ATP-binding protein [Myxococcaceae bacterium]|nr:MAG: ABC transporter ATP-binding protein [Myxococcaceae bacterium]
MTSTLGRLLALLRPSARLVAGAVLAAMVSAAAAAGYAWLIGPLLRSVLLSEPMRLVGLYTSPERARWLLPGLLVALAVVKAGAQLLQTGWMQVAGQRALATLRSDLYAHLLALPPATHESRASGDVLSRLTADVAQVEFSVTQALTTWVRDALQLLALLGVCLVLDWRLFALSFVVFPAALVPITRFARAVKRAARTTQGRLGNLTALVGEQLHALPVVQAFGMEPRVRTAFDAEQARYLREMDRSLLLRGSASPSIELLGITGLALALAVGAQAVRAEPALASHLMSYVGAVLLMYGPLKTLSSTLTQVVAGVGAAERVFELEDRRTPPDRGEQAPPLHRALRLEDLRIQYGEVDALRGLTLELPAGKTVAVVGASGAGKSTLFSALLRFVDPAGGRILWDGQDVRGYSRASVRARIAWVPQEPVLFAGSVRDAVRVGNPDATDPEVWSALARAHGAEFVRALPRGLDTPVGERGAQLSGGQRQRLAIARAFVREPSLLLLDEPTSSLDAASEALVQAGLAELKAGRTTLVVAHRLSTVRSADLIVVLEAGRVVEQGNHEQLVAHGTVYRRLLDRGGADEPA